MKFMKLRSPNQENKQQQTQSTDKRDANNPAPLVGNGKSTRKEPPTTRFNLQNVMDSLICVNNSNRKLQALEEDNLAYSDTSHSSSSVGSADDLGLSPVLTCQHSCVVHDTNIQNSYICSSFTTNAPPDRVVMTEGDKATTTAFTNLFVPSTTSRHISPPGQHGLSDDFDTTQWIMAGTNHEDHHPELEVVATSNKLPVGGGALSTQGGSCRIHGILQNSGTNGVDENTVLRRPDFLKLQMNEATQPRDRPRAEKEPQQEQPQQTSISLSQYRYTVAQRRDLPDQHHNGGSNNRASTSHSTGCTSQKQSSQKKKSGAPNGAGTNASSDPKNMSSSSDEDEDFNKKDASSTTDEDDEARYRAEALLWKTAVDPKSGRPYWYHSKTRETQWARPLCCASPEEREAALRKQRQTRDFFAAMEANILKQMSSSSSSDAAVTSADEGEGRKEEEERKAEGDQTTSASQQDDPLERPKLLVRTISAMEDSVLADLVQRVPSHRQILMDQQQSCWQDVDPMAAGPVRKASIGSRGSSTGEPLEVIEERTSSSSSSEVVVNTSGRQQQEEQSSTTSLPPVHPLQRRKSSEAPSFLRLSSGSNRSTMSRLGSSSGMARAAMMNLVLEGENEDESSTNALVEDFHDEEDDIVLRRLPRSAGTLHLAADGADSSEEVPDPAHDNQRCVGREPSLCLADLVHIQSFANRVDSTTRFTTSRAEESLSLSELAHNNFDHSRQFGTDGDLSRDPSLNLAAALRADSVKPRGSSCDDSGASSMGGFNTAFREGDMSASRWSFVSSATNLGIGLSSEEGEAIKELAAITQEMVEVQNSSPSSTSSGDDDSVEGMRLLSLSDGDDGTALNIADEVKQKSAVKPQTISRPKVEGALSLRVPGTTLLASADDDIAKPRNIQRRNTCGTLYVGTTMSAPDKDATIKCVCGVFRAHILQSLRDGDAGIEEHPIFNDLESLRDPANSGFVKSMNLAPPTLEEITMFYRDVFRRAQMESDCIIMTLIYVERLIKVTDGFLRPRTTNWRSILFSCMVLSSKVWDDLSMWNADFSQTAPAGVEFKLQRVNELELAVLSALKYKVKVPASEYAKYYFLLRSMLIKSGLGSEDLATMNPLDVEGAKQLQHVSSQYQSSSMLGLKKTSMGRAKTVGGSSTTPLEPSKLKANEEEKSPVSPLEPRNKVGLEHLIQM